MRIKCRSCGEWMDTDDEYESFRHGLMFCKMEKDHTRMKNALSLIKRSYPASHAGEISKRALDDCGIKEIKIDNI